MELKLTTTELMDLSALINHQQHITIEHDSITIAVDAKEDDTLRKTIWLAGVSGGGDTKIEKLGIYEHNGLKVWIVKR